ncbi:hypothetical protein ScPMuIL_015009 [Solemya velum]
MALNFMDVFYRAYLGEPPNDALSKSMANSVVTQAIQGGIAPYQEYLLQGSIVDTSRDVLLHRLQGLCDNAEGMPQKFQDHEMVFMMRGNTPQQIISFRVRHSLHQRQNWVLRYTGQTEIGDKNRQTLVRTCCDVATSDNVVQFLNEMGFRLDNEFIAKGFFFHKGRMRVTVSKIYKILQHDNLDNLEQLTMSHLVELSVVAPVGQEQIGEDMKAFAEQLKPLVQLDKIDHRRLQTF